MYTGIVQDIVEVKKLVKKPGLHTLTLSFPDFLMENLKIGASVALDGVCFTVVHFQDNLATFDAMSETLEKTTIGTLDVGSRVNVERSARAGDEIGGHTISGHVHGKAEIINIVESENNHVITFKAAQEWMKYIFPKGFLSVNGCSLTVASMEKSEASFTIFFIPETLRKTTFGILKVGDEVNFEIDCHTQVIVDTIENILAEKLGDFLPPR